MPRAATHAARGVVEADPPPRPRERPRSVRAKSTASTVRTSRSPSRSPHTRARAGTVRARPRRRTASHAPRASGVRAATARAAPAVRPRPRGAVLAAGGAVIRLPVRSAAGLLDRMLRGRGWIALIGALLAGIVFLNVTLLELNGGIGAQSERAGELRRENADLRSEVSRLSATARIQRLAEEHGLWMPGPTQVTYLRPDLRKDSREAARALESGEVIPATPSLDPAAE